MLSTFRSTPAPAARPAGRRRSIRIIAPVVAGALLLGTAACGTSGPAGSASGALTVWTLQDSALNPVQNQEISAFNSTQSAVKASMQTFVNDPYKQKLQTAVGSPEAPDVFLNWGGGNLSTYVQAGDVSDLSSVLAADPTWKSSFLPSVLAGGEIDGKYYGVPMEGVQPVSMFYNKSVFAKAGISAAPTTWPQLLSDVATLKAHGVIPIALGGSESWTELMWLEYLLDRIGGPSKFAAIAADKPGAWQDPAVLEALQDIVQLVDAGGFGTSYASVGQDDGAADALMSSGKAGMELMGSWEYAGQLSAAPSFVKNGDLGWAAFPTVPGGQGNPLDIVGNPSNFFSVSSKDTDTKDAVAFLKTVTSPSYIKGLISIGEVPAVAGLNAQLAAGANASFTTYTYQQVENAPAFTQSWDQALSPSVAQNMLDDLQQVFSKQQTPAQFVSALSSGS